MSSISDKGASKASEEGDKKEPEQNKGAPEQSVSAQGQVPASAEQKQSSTKSTVVAMHGPAPPPADEDEADEEIPRNDRENQSELAVAKRELDAARELIRLLKYESSLLMEKATSFEERATIFEEKATMLEQQVTILKSQKEKNYENDLQKLTEWQESMVDARMKDLEKRQEIRLRALEIDMKDRQEAWLKENEAWLKEYETQLKTFRIDELETARNYVDHRLQRAAATDELRKVPEEFRAQYATVREFRVGNVLAYWRAMAAQNASDTNR